MTLILTLPYWNRSLVIGVQVFISLQVTVSVSVTTEEKHPEMRGGRGAEKGGECPGKRCVFGPSVLVTEH